MNKNFLNLHKAYFANGDLNFHDFVKDSQKLFSSNADDYAVHDKFFNNFTIIWQTFLSQGLFGRAVQLWNDALNIAFEWENKKKKRIHKGTPYYFLGVTSILKDDIENGFLLMHQALEEDKKTHKTSMPNTPAYFFVKLDYSQQNQFFRNNVLEISKFVDYMLAEYRSTRNGNLDLDAFKARFQEEADIQETVLYFVFNLYRLRKLLTVDPKLTHNIFSSLLMTDIVFDLCLIIDNTIKYKNQTKWKLVDHIKFLSRKSSLSLSDTKLGHINQSFQQDFDETLKNLLDSVFRFQDDSDLQKIEEDLAIVYGFRNFSAHKIEEHPIIYERFREIVQRITNTLFFSIEKLYPKKPTAKKPITTGTSVTTSKSTQTSATQYPDDHVS